MSTKARNELAAAKERIRDLEETVDAQAQKIRQLKQDKQSLSLQPEQLARAISNHCNNFDRNGDWVLIKELMNDHRTLQQTFFQLVLRYILEYARGNFDGRNQASVAVADILRNYMIEKELVFARGEDPDKLDVYLPCI